MGALRALADELPDDVKEMIRTDALCGHVFNLADRDSWTREKFYERLAVELFRMKEQYLDVVLKRKQIEPPEPIVVQYATDDVREFLEDVALDVDDRVSGGVKNKARALLNRLVSPPPK